MKLDREILGEKIRQIRKERGFSQEALSEKIDISPRHMCTIENGNSFPSIETFVKISRVLQIDMNKFFNISPLDNLKTNYLRDEVMDLVQTASLNELKLFKDLIIVLKNNMKP